MNIYAIKARFGDCLLIEFGDENPKYILIDGGPDQVYDDFLKKELKRIVKSQKLEAVVISHVDNDHIVGILDFFVDIKSERDTGKKPFMQIKELWLNTFSEIIDPGHNLSNRLDSLMVVQGTQGLTGQMPDSNIALLGIKEGHQLTTIAGNLEIPVNEKTENGFFSVENNADPIKFGKLRFTVIGPTASNLDELRKEWEKWIEKNEERIANGDFELAANSDKSIPNLSSIILLAKEGDKTILLTGDCRSDHLLDGLQQRNLLKNGKLHVNILKVPHHGSSRNATKKFFQDVTADIYLISADGTNDNPDTKTLEWIVEAAHEQGRKIKIIVTNQTTSTGAIVQEYDPKQHGYRLAFIAEGKRSIKVPV